ncbi:MAG TPA: hypothetical protein PKD61_39550, partial [Polyangiaceae bacterium]|nr:hypothetical protein [Polyangiaceae bacterium]
PAPPVNDAPAPAAPALEPPLPPLAGAPPVDVPDVESSSPHPTKIAAHTTAGDTQAPPKARTFIKPVYPDGRCYQSALRFGAADDRTELDRTAH